MGYYATLIDYKINNARINPAKKDEFLEKIKEECHFGFEPDNFKIEIDDKGNIKDFEVEEWHTKWYDEEEFKYILSEYLEEGSVYFKFVGEDNEAWSIIVFPKLTLDGNWIESSADGIVAILNEKEIPQQVKEKILNDYKNYWEKKLKEAQKNLNILKKETGKTIYKVIVPAEETRKVAFNCIKYCNTKEEAEKVKEFIENDGYIGELQFDEYEDVDILDSWDWDIFYKDAIEIIEEVEND